MNPVSSHAAAAAAILAMDPTLNQYYEELGLDDPDTALIRPEMLVANESLLQQREQDLNITPSSGLGVQPNFIFPNRMLRGGASALGGVASTLGGVSSTLGGVPSALGGVSMSESLSILFDQPSFSPTLSQHLSHQSLMTPKSMGGNGIGMSSSQTSGPSASATVGSLYSQSSVPMHHLGMAGLTTATSSRSTVGSNSSPIDVDSYSVKKEADEGSSSTLPPPSPSSSSLHSPTTSDAGSDALDSARRGVKRSLSDASSDNKPSTSGLNGSGTAGPSTSSGASGGPSPSKSKADPNKDPAYLEKRRKNNESAKRSREARRSKEEMVALRVVTLEEENMKLRAESSLLEKELDELRHRLFN
ncbi:D site-binding protein-like [Aplysia californica]|uniref:D site-binding protein-like n=1 Tax=Aplysia californica TaxID=6500 RepID=A0ABM0JY35_APLCA|nr:D site-binding protein-like [Aplysia californica]